MPTLEEGPLVVTPLPETPQAASQPPQTVTDPTQTNELSDAAVREAIARAEANGMDPESLTVADLSQGPTPQKTAEPPQASPSAPAIEVPDKFKKDNGEVDVEKIRASTERLDEAIQQKEEKIQKTVEDYMREYREKENKFRNLPNPERLAAQPPPPPSAPTETPMPYNMTDAQLREALMRDYQADPLATTAQLIDIALKKRFEPLEQERRDNSVRGNIEQLAKKDPRVLQPEVFNAIQQKLNADPDLWKLKNPHKAAWLEVKEELQLGESVRQTPAQPSRAPSPILGGGAPPSAPASSAPKVSAESLLNLDPRRRDQEAEGDAMLRQLLQRER